jgi:hypothetical protein
MSSGVLDPNVLIFVQKSPVFPRASASLHRGLRASGFEIAFIKHCCFFNTSADLLQLLVVPEPTARGPVPGASLFFIDMDIIVQFHELVAAQP